MRILYIDVDSLRYDHLGCYGYQRNTSPNIDTLAAQGVRFTNLYASDAPCLPSRTALWSGRYGIHTGVIDHGGVASQPFLQPERGFRDEFGKTGWMAALRAAGLKTATISPFGERHSAWHWYAGYNEIYNTGANGMESAETITPVALDWLQRNGAQDNWFLHVNLWDPHTPYRTPSDYENPFKDDPLPDFYTPELLRRSREGYGPHSAQEVRGYGIDKWVKQHEPDALQQLETMDDVRWWIDHYDMGVRYADDHIGQMIAALKDLGIYDDTLIMLSADHGENQGELNVWGDHQTADEFTCDIPLVVKLPHGERAGRVDHALHYHFDWAATLIELAGGNVPENWDGEPFTAAFKAGTEAGRDYLVVSQGAWAALRAVRFDRDGHAYICLRTYDDGLKMLDDIMLFDLTADPHEQQNFANARPDLVEDGLSLLDDWLLAAMQKTGQTVDPMETVVNAGGGYHTRGELPAYLERLRATGRAHHADYLEQKHSR